MKQLKRLKLLLHKKKKQKYIRKNIFPIRAKKKINTTEYVAYKWLLNKGIKIDLKKIHLTGKPDFITNKGKLFEIKRMGYGHKNISFTKNQMKEFSDDTIILIFLPFEQEPHIICLFKNLRQKVQSHKKNSSICWVCWEKLINNQINKF
jgi:hypothetical protein